MQAARFYYRIVSFAVIICHVFAGFQFWLKLPELDVPHVWFGQFYFLLAFSLICSLLLFVYKYTQITEKIIFAIQVLLFLLIGYAEGSYLGVEFTLLAALLLETSAYFPLIQSIFVTLALTVITLLAQRTIVAWGIPLSSVSLHDLLLLGGYACILAVLANALHLAIQQLEGQIRSVERLEKAVSQLIETNIEFQQYAITASEQSAVHERKRISRDIHDTAVHTFINVIMLAETVIDSIEAQRENVLQILQQLITLAKEGVRDTRQALRELRAIDEASLKGLKAIQQLCKVFVESTGVQVNIAYGNLPWEFDKDIDLLLYRMIQEGLTNAFRHGKATRIDIHLWIFETDIQTELIVRIRDNGQGASHIEQGIGLQGMEERLQKVQGHLEAKNVPNGFEVSAWIPLHDRENFKQLNGK